MDSQNPTEKNLYRWFSTSLAFFLHFLSLGFAVFPLQTHLRQIHSAPTASILASCVPIAGLLTYFLFGFAERRQWTRQPVRLLFTAALAAGILQLLLGWQLANTQAGRNLLPSFIETGLCLLMLACAHACCMNLLNHLAVASLANHAYSARAAGSAGYMVAILATAALLSDEAMVLSYHLFIAAACALAHIAFVLALVLWAPAQRRPTNTPQNHAESNRAANSAYETKAPDNPWTWRWLILLVGMTSFCEGAFGLYSHEFLTTTYGDIGYYLFAACILLETLLLVCLPFLPNIRKRLLFVGPLGWMLLLLGCLIAQAGWPWFGILSLAMAMNCPFQVACYENAHAIRPQITGLAAIALAQTLGIFCSQWTSALLNRFASSNRLDHPWTNLWSWAWIVSVVGLALAVLIQKRKH